MVPIFFSLLVASGLSITAINLIIRNLLYICQPSEVLIFAGPKRQVGTGDRTVGYRLVKGGKSLRVPLMERAFRMDLTNMIIELKVTNAYSKGGIPLQVEGVANIKIAGEDPTIHNAIERLLGKTRAEIERIAQETLEGNLRGVLASLTPQQINEDKIAFAKSLLEEAEDDLERLGLVLDNLQVQNISDEVGYLDSIGRQQRAELLRDARIAEASSQAESAIKTAENEKKTALKRIEAQIAIAQAEAERRIQDAETKRQALIAEAQSEVEAELARVQADLTVQTERIEQVRQQLQADAIAPAEADMKRALAAAKGRAAKIIEDGKAQAEGIEDLARSWAEAGSHAREVFLFQKLEVLLKTMTATVPRIEVDNITLVDAQQGNLASQVSAFVEQLRHSTGVDLGASLRKQPPASPKPTSGRSTPTPPIAPARPAIAPSSPTPPSSRAQSSGDQIIERLITAAQARVQPLLDDCAEQSVSLTDSEERLRRAITQNSSLCNQLRELHILGDRPILRRVFDHPLVHIPISSVEEWIGV